MSVSLRTLDLNDLNYLLPQTKEVLLELSKFDLLDDFTFVGGSGLSLYLHHRLSEDIDLFSWKDTIDTQAILPVLQDTFSDITIEQSSDKQLDLKLNHTKVTFFANNWDALKDRNSYHGHLYIAQLPLLAGMKLNTLFLRAKFRDYYDLYALNKEVYTIGELYDIIEAIMPGMNKRLFQMALTYIEDVEEDHILHLAPKYQVSKQDIRTHFESKIQEWLRM